MALLLSQSDLQPLVMNLANLEGAFQAIEAAVLTHEAGESGCAAYLQLPRLSHSASGSGEGAALLSAEQATSIYSTSAAAGTTVRIFPSVGTPDPPRDGHLMLLFDSATGQLRALLASDDLNVLRTSVPAGVGARYLAPANARVLGILGTGKQARSHARTFRHALPELERIRVWSPTPAHREAFAAEWSAALGLPVEAVDTARGAVEGADVITAAGRTSGPALEAAWVRPGALLVTMTRAAPADLAARLVVAATRRPTVLAARPTVSGPGRAPEAARAEPIVLADVMQGRLPARRRPEETLVFELAAMYGWDAPIMNWAYRWAVAGGVGTEISLTSQGGLP